MCVWVIYIYTLRNRFIHIYPVHTHIQIMVRTSCQTSPMVRLKVILVFFVPLVKPSTSAVNTKLTLCVFCLVWGGGMRFGCWMDRSSTRQRSTTYRSTKKRR